MAFWQGKEKKNFPMTTFYNGDTDFNTLWVVVERNLVLVCITKHELVENRNHPKIPCTRGMSAGGFKR